MNKTTDPLTPQAVFLRAYALICDERTWTQFVYARDVADEETHETDAAAACFCSLGALYKASGVPTGGLRIREFPPGHESVVAVFDALCQAVKATKPFDPADFGNCTEGIVTAFNDRHDHATVLALWKAVGLANRWLPAEASSVDP